MTLRSPTSDAYFPDPVRITEKVALYTGLPIEKISSLYKQSIKNKCVNRGARNP